MSCLTLLCALPMALTASDILNPKPCYKVFRPAQSPETLDSVLWAVVYFDPLPQFEKETIMSISQGVPWDTEAGLRFSLSGRSLPFDLSAPEYVLTVPGPLARGDSVHADFRITPHQVGVLDLGFTITENTPLGPDFAPPRVFGGGQTNILLAPDGTTKALGSSAVEAVRATWLGPMPDLWVDGRTFHKFALLPDPAPLGMAENAEEFVTKAGAFGIEVHVKLDQSKSQQLNVSIRVTPYHEFERGIGFELRCDSALAVLGMSNSYVGPVSAREDHSFGCCVAWSDPGIHHLSLRFRTPNANQYSGPGQFGAGLGNTVGMGTTLYIGVDEAGELAFVTDRHPTGTFDACARAEVDPEDIDSRYRLARMESELGPLVTHLGNGFESVMVLYGKPSPAPGAGNSDRDSGH